MIRALDFYRSVATVQLGDNEMILERIIYFHSQGEKHRISNNSNDDLVGQEIQMEIFLKVNIVRIEDSFGRK